VLIPHQNVQNLMLRPDVVQAAAEDRFHIYSVRSIDEGLTILTGRPAGARREDGTWEPGTINDLVDQEIQRLSRAAKAAGEDKDAPKE
jgi:predicted ATP-dependent protease